MKSIRVAVLGTRGFPGVQGGVERHCQELYPRLTKFGVRATVYARKGYVDSDLKNYKGVEIIPLPIIRGKSLETILHTFLALMQVAIHRKQFDLVHIHDIGPALLTPLVRLLGLPVIMTYHSQDYQRPKWGRFGRGVLRLGEWCGARFSSAVISVSGYLQVFMKEHYAKNSAKIPNGVVIPEKLAPGKALNQYGLTAGKYVLGVGRLVKEKGFHDLIEAYKEIPTDWRLVIVGGADHEDEYSRSLKKSAAEDSRIVMTGFLTGNPLLEIYSNAGIFVIPSYHEGLPITLLEAMSYGLAVLASDIPPHLELIAEQEIIFPSADVGALRAKLTHFMQSPPETETDNIEYIRKNFDWDRITRETLSVYRQVVENSAP